jgi:UDP-N-acetyl-D-mannosaminuronate dehydrogenase
VARVGEVLSDDALGLLGARVLVVGVAYKPGVADIRESPALEILERLGERGADIAYHDPRVPDLVLGDGRELSTHEEPWTDSWDLVLVHTLHPDTDRSWIHDQPRILDATYRLGTDQCSVV